MSQVLEWVCFYYIQCAGCTLSIQRTLGDKMKDESARKKHKNKWCMRWNTGKSMKFILEKNRSIILLDEKCWCVHTHIIGTICTYLTYILWMWTYSTEVFFLSYHYFLSCNETIPCKSDTSRLLQRNESEQMANACHQYCYSLSLTHANNISTFLR